MKIKTARFWIRWRGSWAKISLLDGESLSLFSAESTEEGYRQEWQTYERVGGEIRSNLTYTPEWGSLRCLPEWQEIDTSRRDHSAEAAGY